MRNLRAARRVKSPGTRRLMRRHSKTIHVADDVHTFLRTEAGRRGVSVEELADVMLRDVINLRGGKTLEVAPVATRSPSPSAAKKKR